MCDSGRELAQIGEVLQFAKAVFEPSHRGQIREQNQHAEESEIDAEERNGRDPDDSLALSERNAELPSIDRRLFFDGCPQQRCEFTVAEGLFDRLAARLLRCEAEDFSGGGVHFHDAASRIERDESRRDASRERRGDALQFVRPRTLGLVQPVELFLLHFQPGDRVSKRVDQELLFIIVRTARAYLSRAREHFLHRACDARDVEHEQDRGEYGSADGDGHADLERAPGLNQRCRVEGRGHGAVRERLSHGFDSHLSAAQTLRQDLLPRLRDGNARQFIAAQESNEARLKLLLLRRRQRVELAHGESRALIPSPADCKLHLLFEALQENERADEKHEQECDEAGEEDMDVTAKAQPREPCTSRRSDHAESVVRSSCRQRRSRARYHPSSAGPKKTTTKSEIPRKMPKGIAACMPRALRNATRPPAIAPVIDAIISSG